MYWEQSIKINNSIYTIYIFFIFTLNMLKIKMIYLTNFSSCDQYILELDVQKCIRPSDHLNSLLVQISSLSNLQQKTGWNFGVLYQTVAIKGVSMLSNLQYQCLLPALSISCLMRCIFPLTAGCAKLAQAVYP